MLEQKANVRYDVSLLSDLDVYLFKQGNHFRLHDKLGAHVMTVEGVQGTYFAVWAPNAESVSVMGDFNGWNTISHPLSVRWDGSGIWEGFLAGVTQNTAYKYHIVSRENHYCVDKGDPFGYYWEVSPRTASVVWDLNYDWGDGEWMRDRFQRNALESPMAIYELHLGSWRRVPEDQARFLNYRELAHELAPYLKDMGFTHV